MGVKRVAVLVLLLVGISRISIAGEPAASWLGPVGLYTQPTAESLTAGDLALTFAEIRFSQENDRFFYKSTWFTSSATYALTSRLEVVVVSQHECVQHFTFDNNWSDKVVDDNYYMGHVKYVLLPVCPDRVGLAIGVLDVTDATREIDGFDTDRGRRVYLVGTYDWFTLGLSHDAQGVGLFAGARLAITDRCDLITEWVSNAVFVQVDPPPSADVNFNAGLRLYPCQIPNLRFDLTAVGDGRFDFGFSFSYIFK